MKKSDQFKKSGLDVTKKTDATKKGNQSNGERRKRTKIEFEGRMNHLKDMIAAARETKAMALKFGR